MNIKQNKFQGPLWYSYKIITEILLLQNSSKFFIKNQYFSQTQWYLIKEITIKVLVLRTSNQGFKLLKSIIFVYNTTNRINITICQILLVKINKRQYINQIQIDHKRKNQCRNLKFQRFQINQLQYLFLQNSYIQRTLNQFTNLSASFNSNSIIKLSPYIKNPILQQKCKINFKLKMEGQQIPKATMTNFLKTHLKITFSADFANKMLALSKDYVNRLTEQANDICTKNDKKTINAQHVQAALVNFGLDNQLKQLKQMSSLIKQQNQMKQQFRQRIQQNIQKNLQQIQGEANEPRVVLIKQNIDLVQIDADDQSQQIDYQAQMDEQPQQKKEVHSSKSTKKKDKMKIPDNQGNSDENQ